MTWGRPEKPIDWKIVESMIDSQCPGVDIAAHFRIAKQTFYRKFEEHYGTNFSTYVTDNSPGGKALLRLAQFQKALNNKSPGNAQMLIWLGKNLLGQKDFQETPLTEAPNQSQIDKDHIIMKLQHEIEQLKQNANEPKTE